MTDPIEQPPGPGSRMLWYNPDVHQQRLLALLRQFTAEVNSERVRRAISKHTLDKVMSAEQLVTERLRADFTLVVVGNFKNGKSTLINALLGSELVTTNVTPETVTINQIRYGAQQHVEAILVGGGRVTIPLEDLPADRLVPTLTTIRGGIIRPEAGKSTFGRERELRQILSEYFNKSELNTLCFDLGVNYEDLGGKTLTDQARELIAYMKRRNRLAELIEACRLARPNINAIADDEAALPDEPRIAQRVSKLEQLRDAISHLVIEAPIDWLRGLCLVDTPGMADLHGFDEQVRAFLPRCDAIIFVISALSPLSEEERLFLQRYILPRDFAKVCFVINRMDEMRTEEDARNIVGRVRGIIQESFPGAPVFAVSALEECERLETGTVGGPRAATRAAEFAGLRATIQDSILLNRDTIRLERAASETDRMLVEFQASIERLSRAISTDQDRRSELIDQCEDRSSQVYLQKEEHRKRTRVQLDALRDQTIVWLGDFIDRFDVEVVSRLSLSRLEDIQRYFHFFLSDVLREAIGCCLEAQRPAVLELLATARESLRGEIAAMDELLNVSTASEVAVRSMLDDMSWAKLDDLRVMVDQSLVSIFSMAEELVLPVAGILFQRQRENDRQRVDRYQQKLREMLPGLREAILTELHSLYNDLGNEIDRQIEGAYQQDIDAALVAVRQAQEHHEAGQEEVEVVSEICQELLDLIGETREELLALRQQLTSSVPGYAAAVAQSPRPNPA